MSARYVQHDGARWRVQAEITIDGDPGFELARRVMTVVRPGDGRILHRPRTLQVIAREIDCTPDQHEPVRVLRDAGGVLRYNVKRGIVMVSEPGSRRKFSTTLKGIVQMCARAEASRRAAEKAHKRRTRRRA